VKWILKTVALLAAVGAMTSCASVLDLDGALAMAPYHIEESGRIVVEVSVNGEGPFDFALDTGSTISAVFEPLRDKLSLEIIPGRFVIVHGTAASGKHSLLNIGSMAVGREVWTEPRVVLLPGQTSAGGGIRGVIGTDFLRRYAIGFSTEDRVIRLLAPDLVARRVYRGWASVPLQARSIAANGATLYFIDVGIDGRTISAVFDLGSGSNMMNWPGAQSLNATITKPDGDNVIVGAIGDTPVIAELRAETVTTAGIRWRNEIFSIADLEIFETFMLGESPAAILGAGLFTQRDFVIDFVRNRLLVKVSMDEVDSSSGGVAVPGAR
jgi:predicted aspartyl protease